MRQAGSFSRFQRGSEVFADIKIVDSQRTLSKSTFAMESSEAF